MEKRIGDVIYTCPCCHKKREVEEINKQGTLPVMMICFCCQEEMIKNG